LKRKSSALITVAVAVFALTCCKPAETGLTTKDLSGPANLSPAQRAAFTGKCVAHRAELFNLFFDRHASTKPEEVQEVRRDIEQTFPRFCSCLEQGLEKRVSTMQYRMAEAMIDQNTYITELGSPIPEFESLKKEAAQLGMSEAGFENARRSFRVHAFRAGESCFQMLSAPSLARLLHLPEENWYPGPADLAKDAAASRLEADKAVKDQAAFAYSFCLSSSISKRASIPNDPPEAIERGALALCEKNKLMILDAYGESAGSSSSEIIASLENQFRRQLAQIVVKMREAAVSPKPAPTKTKRTIQTGYSWKLTIAVNTPDGIKRASSVSEISLFDVSAPTRGIVRRVVGEALYLDLGPNARPLVALLTNTLHPPDDDKELSRRDEMGLRWSDEAGPNLNLLLRLYGLSPSPNRDTDPLGDASRVAQMRGVAHPIASSDLPDLVTFTDINDPASVIKVDPNNLEATLGKGISWHEITLEITDEPTTEAIDKRLHWLLEYRKKGVSLDGAALITKQDPANALKARNFVAR